MGEIIHLTTRFQKRAAPDWFVRPDEPDFTFRPQGLLAHPDLVADPAELYAFTLTLQRQGFEEVRHKTIGHAIDAANDVPGLSDNALHLLHAIGDSCRLHHERYIPLCYEALDAMTGHACQPIEPVLVELSRLARIHILTVGLPYRDQPLAFVTIVCTSSDRTLGCLPNDVTNMNPTEGWSHE